MEFLSQSSLHGIEVTEALDLLRYTPHLIVSQGSPTLHYHFPLGIWEGSPVHYTLQSGMLLHQWRGTLIKREGHKLIVSLMPVFSGAWVEFKASHTFEEQDSGVCVRDEFQFSAPGSPIENLLARSVCVYKFDARKWVARSDSEAKTTSIKTIRNIGTAG